MEWFSYEQGRKWMRDYESGEVIAGAKPDGPFTFIERDGGYLYRTKGDPISAYTALQDWGYVLDELSEVFNVPIEVIFAMMAIEAKREKADKSHFKARSLRKEPGYISDWKTPNKVSPGLMQTLISTADWINRKMKLYHDFDGSLERFTREDLFVPQRSLTLGTAYIRHHIDTKEPDEAGFDDDDPILLCSAYNAGSVRPGRNDWHLMTYGTSRMDKYIAYLNDMVAVLKQRC